MARILIIEDEPALASALQRGLQDERYAVDVEFEGEGGLWAAEGGEYELVLLRNLLSNAVRHSEGPSEVTVRLFVAEDEAVLEVEDRGEGIPADQIVHVFERFHRVDKARARARGGAGLGLSIVQVIATQHGGSAVVQSVVGQGTLVRVRVPRR